MSRESQSNILSLLNVLRHGDSFFPSGAVAFSYGLESLSSDGSVNSFEHIEEFIHSQLYGRWAGLDRACLVSAHTACLDQVDIKRLIEIDHIMDAATLPSLLREGSLRAGAAILGVHTKLKTPGVTEYREYILSGNALGHLAVSQGACFSGSGLSVVETEVISAHTLVVGLASAAIRLGIIGHIESQSLISLMGTEIEKIISLPAPEIEEAWCFSPVSDIAVMKHEVSEGRLFSN